MRAERPDVRDEVLGRQEVSLRVEEPGASHKSATQRGAAHAAWPFVAWFVLAACGRPDAVDPARVEVELAATHGVAARAVQATGWVIDQRRAPIVWSEAPERGVAFARREGRRLVAFVRADWSVVSVELARDLSQDHRVAEQLAGAVWFDLDLTESTMEAERFFAALEQRPAMLDPRTLEVPSVILWESADSKPMQLRKPHSVDAVLAWLDESTIGSPAPSSSAR
jgi:hypothetical protein